MLQVNEALEIALQAIDSETSTSSSTSSQVSQPAENSTEVITQPRSSAEPIYENIGESVRRSSPAKPPMEPPLPAPRFPQTTAPLTQHKQPQQQQQTLHHDKPSSDPEDDQEPYYQVPKKIAEPLYEVPKYQKPIPVYENIEIFYPGTGITAPLSPLDSGVMEPPKEKPPPPPIDDATDDEEETTVRKSSTKPAMEPQMINDQPMKRMNSTKRIKKELRNKRSSFLGIEGSNDDETYLELTVAPPPDMAQLLQEERRLEKQLYMKAGLYDSSDAGDSRDSGVSENHSRQSSEPFTNSSEEHEDLLVKKEKEIIEVLEKEEEKQRNAQNLKPAMELPPKPLCIDDQLHENDEVLRVERELLQLEQEELKRQRENLILRDSLARHDLGHGAKMLMSANRRSMNDINTVSNGVSNGHYANIPNQIYQIETDYCKSMTDLHETKSHRMPHAPPPVPPAKPMRSNIIIDSRHSSGLVKIASPTRVQHSQSIDELAPLRNYQPNYSLHPGNMSRHTLHALSAAPKPKFTDGWVQSRNGIGSDKYNNNNNTWLSYQEKRRSVPEGFNCNKHWLVQEAEQRRIEQQRGIRSSASSLSNGWSSNSSLTSSPTKCAIQRNGSHDNKPLPDAVIQTLTQRVQSKGIGERRRFDPMQSSVLSSTTSLLSVSTPQLNQLNANTAMIPEGSSDKVLSVSGKKKCSHCGEELGRGAAMIIESLRLFYHIDCFKCCVCHVQLSDGLNGTDVRVRNQKLHCQNCYSSDDGIKFSCV
ncbi:unnamed protein product [Hermetia illucens]|uniref:LIM zinc-binding domain-containing protein n=1 Tax=Hermetia illucens TaxID=343691 RepID=A0A7R8V5R4_HERIL|nr:unnamed protein product [Hermetia illucens]